jgi:hypothetical protein
MLFDFLTALSFQIVVFGIVTQCSLVGGICSNLTFHDYTASQSRRPQSELYTECGEKRRIITTGTDRKPQNNI